MLKLFLGTLASLAILLIPGSLIVVGIWMVVVKFLGRGSEDDNA